MMHKNCEDMSSACTTSIVGRDCPVTVEFWNCSSNPMSNVSLGTFSTSNGVATTSVTYPNDNRAHAYAAKIVSAGGPVAVQGIISSPVQMTVGKGTRLSVYVLPDQDDSNKHVIMCQLTNEHSNGLTGRHIEIRVNQTPVQYPLFEESPGWYETWRLNPWALCNKERVYNEAATFMITASFEGEQPLNSTGWAYTLDGQRYAALNPLLNRICLP